MRLVELVDYQPGYCFRDEDSLIDTDCPAHFNIQIHMSLAQHPLKDQITRPEPMAGINVHIVPNLQQRFQRVAKLAFGKGFRYRSGHPLAVRRHLHRIQMLRRTLGVLRYALLPVRIAPWR